MIPLNLVNGERRLAPLKSNTLQGLLVWVQFWLCSTQCQPIAYTSVAQKSGRTFFVVVGVLDEVGQGNWKGSEKFNVKLRMEERQDRTRISDFPQDFIITNMLTRDMAAASQARPPT